MSLPIVQIKRRNKNTDEEYSTANQLNGLIEGELGYNYFDNGLWIGPQGSTDGRDYSILVNENHKLDANSTQTWENGTTEGPRLILKEVDERSSDRHEVKTAAIPSATAGRSGVITTGDQAFAGMKTFRNIKIANSDGTYVATIEGPGATNTFKLPNTGGTFVTHATKGTAVGNSTKPVYIATTGRATACSTYAGGTKVTLNNTNKGASTASFYAPTASGSANQVLFSAGANAEPVWADQSSINAGSVGGYTRANMYADMATWLNATSNVYTIIVEGDTDKLDMYYPVYIDLSASREVPTIVSVFKDLGSKTPADYEGNHTNGTSSMWLLYEARNSYWDGNGGYVKTLYSYQGYAPLCAHMERANKGKGGLILWLRGGGDGCEYKIAVTNRLMATPTIYYEETNLGSSTHPITVAPKQGIATTDNRGIYSSTLLGYGDVRGNLQGNATSADHLKTARTIFGKSFDGSGNVAGKAIVYGTRVATAGDRYYYGALEIRENGLVEDKQTDISYAPTIGFHWGGKAAGTIALGSDAKFYAYKQNGTDKATFVTNVEGNASTASALKLSEQVGSGTQPIYFKADGTPTATTYALHKTVPSNALFTDASVKQEASNVDSWRPLLMHKNYANEGVDPGGATDQVHYNATISANPKQGIVRATTFKGNLSGTATDAIELNKITLASSSNSYSNYYKAFATAKVSKAYQQFGGVFLVTDNEGGAICGIVRIKARTSSTYDVGIPTIEWIALNRDTLLDAIVAVKNANGDYTYYIKATGDWVTYQIACLQKDAAVTMAAGSSWVTKDSISAKIVATSSLKGMANTADKFRTTRTIALSGDASGSTTFDGSADATISVTVKDDSHNHIIANVDNLQTTLDSKLPLAGGTMTGLVNYKTTNYTSIPIKIYDDGTNYGHSLVIGADGTTYIGGGESAKALYDATYVPKSTEDLILSADSVIRFQTNVQNQTASSKGIILDAANILYPATSKNGSIGSASYRWDNGYFASVNTNSFLANRTGYTPFSIETTTDLVNKNLEAVQGSYLHHVFLLLPVPTTKDKTGHNYIDGTFYCRKTGANVYDTVRVSINCVYNQLYYYIDAFGQHTPWTLCRCKYNGIDYYALKCPYHANPYTHVDFFGRINSDLPGGTHHETTRQPLPIDIAYYYTPDSGAAAIQNSEVYNSLSDTLTTSVMTSASIRRLHNYAGFTGPTIELTKSNDYNFIYTSGSSGLIALCANQTQAAANSAAIITSNALRPGATNTFALGNASYVWNSGHFKRLHLYGATNNDMTTTSANPALVFAEAGTNPVQPVYLMYTDYDTYRSPAGLKVFGEGEASPAWFEVEGTMFADKGVIGATSTSGSYDFYVNGTAYITGDTKIAGTLMLTKAQDAEAGVNTTQPALIVGGTQAGTHLEIDDNEIMAKSNGTTATTLYLNAGGGAVSIGTGGLTCNSSITPGSNNAYYLGSSSLNWKKLYIREIVSSAALALSSASGSAITLTSGSTLNLTSASGSAMTLTSGSTLDLISASGSAMTLTSGSTLWLKSGSSASLIFCPQGTEQGRFNTSGQLELKSTGANKATIIGPSSADGTFYFPNTGGTFVTHATRGTAVGSSSRPVYIASTGRATGITSVSVSYGGTGKTTLDSGCALIGNGTSAVSLRSITNNTSATAVTASTNLITANTLYYHTGNSNITTVGTISSGTWNGSTIGVAYGGTGNTTGTAKYTLTGSAGSSSDTHATALKTYFTNNKSTVGRNKLATFYSSAMSNGSLYMGYYLSGYDSTPYGGFFVAHYNTPYYVGISNGTFTQYQLSTVGHTHSEYLPTAGGTMTGNIKLGSYGILGYGATVPSGYYELGSVDAANAYSVWIGTKGNANGDETSGIKLDGDKITFWCPGDSPGVRFLDSDSTTSVGYVGITALSYNATSDARLKCNLRPFEHGDILSLPLYKFDYISGAKDKIGCLAQDLQAICPEIVHVDYDGYLSIEESKIVYLLLDKMKKMQEEIMALKEDVAHVR